MGILTTRYEHERRWKVLANEANALAYDLGRLWWEAPSFSDEEKRLHRVWKRARQRHMRRLIQWGAPIN